jgi:hypothetical protein
VFTKGTKESITDWDLTKFLIVVIIIEHVLMVIQILLSIIIDDKPEFVKTGERERDILLSKYKDLKAHDLHL